MSLPSVKPEFYDTPHAWETTSGSTTSKPTPPVKQKRFTLKKKTNTDITLVALPETLDSMTIDKEAPLKGGAKLVTKEDKNGKKRFEPVLRMDIVAAGVTIGKDEQFKRELKTGGSKVGQSKPRKVISLQQIRDDRGDSSVPIDTTKKPTGQQKKSNSHTTRPREYKGTDKPLKPKMNVQKNMEKIVKTDVKVDWAETSDTFDYNQTPIWN